MICNMPKTTTIDAIALLLGHMVERGWSAVQAEAVADNAAVIAWDNNRATVDYCDMVEAIKQEVGQ